MHCPFHNYDLIYWTLLYTKILEVNLFAFAYRLFHREFSPLNGVSSGLCCMYTLFVFKKKISNTKQDGRDVILNKTLHSNKVKGFVSRKYSVYLNEFLSQNHMLAYFTAQKKPLSTS